MFKVFPATTVQQGTKLNKVPIAEAAGWRDIATNDQTIINQWQNLYGYKIKYWGVPTGTVNNILVLDVDVKTGGLETIKNFYVPSTMSQRTMSGGTHYIFKYPNDGNIYGNRTAFEKGLDIRGEGGYIFYYGADSTPIAEAPEWLKQAALAEKKIEIDITKLVKVGASIVQASLTDACEKIVNAPDGESNNVLNIESFKIGQYVPSGSISYDDAFNALFKAAKERGKPDYEAKATIKSGLDGGSKTPITSPFDNVHPELTIPEQESPVSERWTPRFFKRSDLANTSKLRKPQLFKEWSTEDISITTADGGTGKTTLKLVEAICLALGEPFLGFECVAPGRTLFITGEDTSEKLGAMIGMILKQMGIFDDDDKVNKVLNSIVIKKDADLCLITKTRDGFINVNPEAIKKVLEAVEDIRPKLIVFDPISSFWGSESALNDMAKAVSKFMAVIVERSNACVEIINHMGKASSSSKDMSQFAGRGGTGLPSHARVSRVLRGIDTNEFKESTGYDLLDNQSAIMCNVNKFTDGSEIYNKPFIIVREGYLFSKVTLEIKQIKKEQEKQSDTERIFSYIKEERSNKKYPAEKFINAYFSTIDNKISKERIKNAIAILQVQGHLGEKIKIIENPEIEVGGKAYIITDMDGKEVT